MVKQSVKVKPLRIALPLMVGLVLASVTYQLGQWQTGRADEKLVKLAQQEKALTMAPVTPESANLDPDELAYRKLEVEGTFLANQVIYIDNRQFAGKPAVQVIQAFKPKGRDFVIPVDRGYLVRDPREPRRAPELPDEANQGNVVTLLRATLLPRFARSAELRGLSVEATQEILKIEQNGYPVWSNFDTESFGNQVGEVVSKYVATVQPVKLTSQPDQSNQTQKQSGFYIEAVKLPEQVAKHKGYAFQWFAMTVALLVLTAFLIIKELKDIRTSK